MTEAAPGVRAPATYQDVLDAPPNMVAELIEGALHLHPRPAARHNRASSRLGTRLDGPFDSGEGGPGGWIILDEPEMHLGPDVLVPDIAGWRRERMPVIPDVAWLELAPDWVCEVISPSTRSLVLGAKRRLYARNQVNHLWLVDPDARTLEAFALEGDRWSLLDTLTGDATVRLPPFEAVAFALAALWADTASPERLEPDRRERS
jgi:Uma2 family endonuclease